MNFDYEVRSAEEAFHDVPAMTIKGEMLDLAKHIISTRQVRPQPVRRPLRGGSGRTRPCQLEGKPIELRKPPAPTKVVDLMEALRQSAGVAGGGKRGRAAKTGTSSSKSSGRGTATANKTANAAQKVTARKRPAPSSGDGARPADPAMAWRPTAGSATSRLRRSRAARRSPPARATATSSRNTPLVACTTTCGWSWTAC